VRPTSTNTAGRNGVTYRRQKGSPWPSIVCGDARCHDCGEPFEPICSTYKCPARRTVLVILRAEREPEPTKYAGTLPDGTWGFVTEAEAKRQRLEADRPTRQAKRARPERVKVPKRTRAHETNMGDAFANARRAA
jgi:hypothetical protein